MLVITLNPAKDRPFSPPQNPTKKYRRFTGCEVCAHEDCAISKGEDAE